MQIQNGTHIEKKFSKGKHTNIDGLMKDCSISHALEPKILKSSTTPLILIILL